MSYQSTLLEENFFHYLVTGSEMFLWMMVSLIIDFSSLKVLAIQALQWTEGLN